MQDIIDQISYDMGTSCGYADGYLNGYEYGYRKCALDSRKRSKRQKERKLYFLKQKVIGISLLGITGLLGALTNGDVTFAILTVPVALYLIFSKKRWING